MSLLSKLGNHELGAWLVSCCLRSLDLLLKGINIHLSRFCPWTPRGPKPGLW